MVGEFQDSSHINLTRNKTFFPYPEIIRFSRPDTEDPLSQVVGGIGQALKGRHATRVLQCLCLDASQRTRKMELEIRRNVRVSSTSRKTRPSLFCVRRTQRCANRIRFGLSRFLSAFPEEHGLPFEVPFRLSNRRETKT